jgi:hypothetical protein
MLIALDGGVQVDHTPEARYRKSNKKPEGQSVNCVSSQVRPFSEAEDPKNLAKNWRFLKLHTASFCDHNIVCFLRKTPVFFAKNWQKSQKIVTSGFYDYFITSDVKCRNVCR